MTAAFNKVARVETQAPDFLPGWSGLIQRRCACGGSSGGSGQCSECEKKQLKSVASPAHLDRALDRAGKQPARFGHDFERVSVNTRAPQKIQAKLNISSPGDMHEREADRVAEQIMRMPSNSLAASTGAVGRTSGATVQSKPDESLISLKGPAEDDEIKGKLSGPAPEIAPSVEQDIRRLSGGHPLPFSERSFFESRFGHSFGDVRVHADTQGDSLARAVNARAFTRGNHIAFASGQYSPGTTQGRGLMAHELTHVVQQGYGAPVEVQRDLATPPPSPAKPKKPDLTDADISAAIDFNKARYDDRSTREIQDLVGTKPTGTWVKEDIQAVARLQEEFGLTKNGRVNEETYRFLDNEVRAEKLSKTEEKHCLLSFNVAVDPVVVSPVTGGGRSITAVFKMSAQFSNYCGCSDYEYRQFIRGHWKRERGGVVTDQAVIFRNEPAGQLNEAFDEDGNTTTPALNYGHRDQAKEKSNHYLDDTGKEDQAAGCRYEGNDNPGAHNAVKSGDVFDLDVNFRGEIQRKGVAVATKTWTAIKGRFPVP